MSESSRIALPILCLGMVTVLVLLGGVMSSTVVGVSSAGGETSENSHSQSGVLHDTSSVQDNGTLVVESNTTFVIDIQADGDARWTVTERFNLSTEHDREAFEEIATEFESGAAEGSDLGFEAFQRAGELVDQETDREVNVTDAERTSSIDGNVGKLTLSFTWENFARSNGNKLSIDDVFETERGLWFAGLTPSQTLEITSPDGFGFDDANVLPEDGQLKWEGPASFTNETLQAVLVGDGGGTTTPTSTPSPSPSPTPGVGSGDGLGSMLGPVALVLGGVGMLGAVAVIAVMMGGTERVRTVLSKGGTQEESEPVEEGSDAGAETATQPPESDSDSDIDIGLLSDEERVERLLEQNGGRMKQATIVKETGWSNAKVSQLLSSMEEEERINKLRIGRENLISFPDEDVTEIGDS
jgi:hypothetical protein